MNDSQTKSKSAGLEVDLKSLLGKLSRYKFLFLVSTIICLALAFFYIKMATPAYEVGASLLIDPSGKSRLLGESRYVDGGVGIVEPEKNIFNEIGIIKSFGLIRQTVEELKFDVSYYVKTDYKEQEHYGSFPFEVVIDTTNYQIFDVPFFVELLSEEEYRLYTEAKNFEVTNIAAGSSFKVKDEFAVSKVYKFGEAVENDYFHFTLNRSEDKVVFKQFGEEELFFMVHDLDNVTNAYLENLEVNQLDIQSSILDIRIVGPVVEKEIDFLDRLSLNYIQAQLHERDQIALKKEAFIQEQLASISDSLAKAEQNLEAFRRNSQSVDLSQTASIALNQVQTLQSRQSQIKTNLKYFESQLKNLGDSSSAEMIIAPSVVGINDPILNENLLELKRLYSERNRLKFIKGSQSLDLELVDQQIENSTSQVRENLRSLIQSYNLSLQEVEYQIANQEGVISRLPGNEKKLLNFQRTGDLYENLYNYLSQELAKTGIAKSEDTPDTKIIDEARMLGTGPIAPQKKLILAIGFVMGLILPLGWIVLYDSIDETLQNVEELEAATDIPVVASIATNPSGLLFPVSKSDEWKVEESFRDLTATLQFLIPDPNKNVIGISSTLPGEGKTFCSINMGIHFAKAGKKVLLIDIDFRKPSNLEVIANDEKAKFSSFLLDQSIASTDIVHIHPEEANFHFIPSQMEDKNPHVFLSSRRFATLLTEMRSKYDYIIVDSPAIGLASDYLLISRFIDINLFVLRRKVSKLSFLKNLSKLKRRGKLKNVNLIFNGAVGKSFKYGYSRYDYAERRKLVSRFGLRSIKNWLF